MTAITTTNPEIRTITFTSDQLNFDYVDDSLDILQEALHARKKPKFGSIYRIAPNRLDDYDLMVIIDTENIDVADDSNNTDSNNTDQSIIHVIYPRLRYVKKEDGTEVIMMGCDKTQEIYTPPFKHDNCNPGKNGDWTCICGGLEKLKQVYADTFKEVDAFYTYHVIKTTTCVHSPQICIGKCSYINDLDIPLFNRPKNREETPKNANKYY